MFIYIPLSTMHWSTGAATHTLCALILPIAVSTGSQPTVPSSPTSTTVKLQLCVHRNKLQLKPTPTSTPTGDGTAPRPRVWFISLICGEKYPIHCLCCIWNVPNPDGTMTVCRRTRTTRAAHARAAYTRTTRAAHSCVRERGSVCLHCTAMTRSCQPRLLPSSCQPGSTPRCSV